MTYHGNAKLTLRQRHELVLEIEAGSTLRAAAAARNVAPAAPGSALTRPDRFSLRGGGAAPGSGEC